MTGALHAWKVGRRVRADNGDLKMALDSLSRIRPHFSAEVSPLARGSWGSQRLAAVRWLVGRKRTP